MTYDTTIQTRTTTERVTTVHVRYIDWDYDFNDPRHTSCLCVSAADKAAHIADQIATLKMCEGFADGGVYASNYGGWPRIWHRVVGVGMVSQWPYWTPRPCVLVESTLGCEWVDWNNLTGAEVRLFDPRPDRPTADGD
jgi:hypothetical protein